MKLTMLIDVWWRLPTLCKDVGSSSVPRRNGETVLLKGWKVAYAGKGSRIV